MRNTLGKSLKRLARALRVDGRAVFDMLHAFGGACGVAALLWATVLAGELKDLRWRHDHHVKKGAAGVAVDAPHDVSSEGLGSLPALATESAPADAATPSEMLPEVWTRMGGLNVWIAGRRQARGDGQSHIVVMLHGYGRPRETLLMLAEREAARFGTTFLFPEAPIALDWRRRAWWRTAGRPHEELAASAAAARAGLTAARDQIVSLLGEIEQRWQVGGDEIVLTGFSQGATLALEVALSLEGPLGGLALLSIKSLGGNHLRGRLTRLKDVPVLVAHGRQDPLAPFAAADRLQRSMQSHGVDVVWVPYDGGHVVSVRAQRQFSRFISDIISPTSTASVPAANGPKGPSESLGDDAQSPSVLLDVPAPPNGNGAGTSQRSRPRRVKTPPDRTPKTEERKDP